jgi:hypothetical protein
MTIDKLKKLDDDDLFQYFIDNARHSPDAPVDSKYNIRFGSKHLHSSETHLLRDLFFKKVRKAK